MMKTHPKTTNVLMAGVGGQGVLVASEILALAALAAGMEAKQSEVHGVAQRGGSVVSHVRYGDRVYSPLIRCGDVDVLYASEQLEALRYAHYLRSGGQVVMSDQIVRPIQLPDLPEQEYPEGAESFLRGKGYELVVIPALPTAVELGDKRCANVVLLGALETQLAIPEEAWQIALERRLPPKVRELNRQAFERGRAMVRLVGRVS